MENLNKLLELAKKAYLKGFNNDKEEFELYLNKQYIDYQYAKDVLSNLTLIEYKRLERLLATALDYEMAEEEKGQGMWGTTPKEFLDALDDESKLADMTFDVLLYGVHMGVISKLQLDATYLEEEYEMIVPHNLEEIVNDISLSDMDGIELM